MASSLPSSSQSLEKHGDFSRTSLSPLYEEQHVGSSSGGHRQNSPRTRQRPVPVNTAFNEQDKRHMKGIDIQNSSTTFGEDSYLTSFMSNFSFLSDALDGTLITNGEPVSHIPSFSSDRPIVEESTALDLVVPAGKKVKCTTCGIKLSAADAISHVCNLSEIFTRCSHCGEKVSLLETSIHWCDGAIEGKRLEPPSPGSPLVDAFTQFAATAASSSATTALATMGSAMDSAAECATYSKQVGNQVGHAALEVANYSSKNISSAAGAAAAASVVVAVAKNVSTSWMLRLGYDLAAAPQFHPGREVEFESELMKGSVFVALKRDVNLDPKTHHSFFDGKGRTVQLQWSVTLKRKLQGPLFIGFESNQSRQTGSLPRGTMQSCLISALSMFHAKKDLHLHLPSSQKPINVDNDWGLGVVGHKALVSFFETASGESPPRLDRPLESNMKCINYQDMQVGLTYSFCWYTQYVEFTDMTLVNLPMVGRYGLPFNAVRCVLYEHSPSDNKLSPTPSQVGSMLNPPGSLRMITKKAKARAGVDKQSLAVGDFLVGRMVVVLELGTASDGTPRARVRGPGTPKTAPPSNEEESEEVKEQNQIKRRKSKAVVELDAWISASLLDNPAKDKAMGNSADRTYGFSCIFATA